MVASNIASIATFGFRLSVRSFHPFLLQSLSFMCLCDKRGMLHCHGMYERAGAGVRHARRRAALCADWPEAAARRPPGNIYLGVYFCTCIRYDVEQRTAEICWHRLCIPSF